jgi:hypothetical protein
VKSSGEKLAPSNNLIIETDGRVFKLRIGDDDVPVSSDRITPAPVSDPEPRNREDPIDETARLVAAEDDDGEEDGYEGAPTDELQTLCSSG